MMGLVISCWQWVGVAGGMELGLRGRSLWCLNLLLGWIESIMQLQCKCLGLGDCNSDFHVFHEISWGEVLSIGRKPHQGKGRGF